MDGLHKGICGYQWELNFKIYWPFQLSLRMPQATFALAAVDLDVDTFAGSDLRTISRMGHASLFSSKDLNKFFLL